MNFYYVVFNIIPEALCIALALTLWIRTRHRGFGWFVAAFLVHSLALYLYTFYFQQFISRVSATYVSVFYLLLMVPRLAFLVLVAIGLWSFRHPVLYPQHTTPFKLPAFNWTTVKRRGVGIIGVGLVFGGIATIVRGLRYMQMYGGEVSDLGAGPGAIIVGMMCIGLSLHPKSPFQERKKKEKVQENTDENTP
jgi:hypothetical protein